MKKLSSICLLLTTALTMPFTTAIASSALQVYWDFNDASDPGKTADRVHGVVGGLLGGAAFSPDGGGASGQPGDRCVDFGAADALTSVHVADGSLFNEAGVTDELTVAYWQQLYFVSASSAFWAESPSSSGG